MMIMVSMMMPAGDDHDDEDSYDDGGYSHGDGGSEG